jgi:hypothetical protein
VVCPSILLAKKKIKGQKKKWTKKRKNSKKIEEIGKGAHREHSIALLFVVPFALSIFLLLPFIFISLLCLS